MGVSTPTRNRLTLSKTNLYWEAVSHYFFSEERVKFWLTQQVFLSVSCPRNDRSKTKILKGNPESIFIYRITIYKQQSRVRSTGEFVWYYSIFSMKFKALFDKNYSIIHISYKIIDINLRSQNKDLYLII